MYGSPGCVGWAWAPPCSKTGFRHLLTHRPFLGSPAFGVRRPQVCVALPYVRLCGLLYHTGGTIQPRLPHAVRRTHYVARVCAGVCAKVRFSS